ncbi:MAG: hypothetical protein GC181_11560 [Bacteroidetes bacterium]|nr:hypothetical protein [Bacteroidota bacterium]
MFQRSLLNVLLTFVLLISIQPVLAQDYIRYNRIVNRIDEDVLAGNIEKASLRFDTIYLEYDFIFSHHCFKALQISCDLKDSVKAANWLQETILRGIPLWAIQKNEITQEVFNYTNCRLVINNYENLQEQYKASINQKLAKTIDSLLAIDQKRTDKVNNGFIPLRYTWHYVRWRRNSRKQFLILEQIINKYGYPGERLIGIPEDKNDSSKLLKDALFYGPFYRESRTYIMLIHYYSRKGKNIDSLLLNEIVKGNLPAFQYGGLNDFMSRYGKADNYYNVWHFDPDTSSLSEINLRRDSLGLNSFETQQALKKIWMERRKNKTANSEIILEY